jgi:hypothetical protein
MIGSPFRTTRRSPRPPPPDATRSAATTIHGTGERGLTATGVEAIHAPRTASAGRILAPRVAERVLRGRGGPAADATRAIEDAARPSTVRTRPASGLMPSIASTGRAEADSEGRFEFVCFRVGVATVAEPISMPPPESGPSEPSLAATGDTATGADPVGDSGGEGGVGAGFGRFADVGGAGRGSDGGAGGVSGAEGGKGAPRGGRSVSGST